MIVLRMEDLNGAEGIVIALHAQSRKAFCEVDTLTELICLHVDDIEHRGPQGAVAGPSPPEVEKTSGVSPVVF